ncbi:MAG TPA: TatD family hydrolase [Gammaproteobacteria bacterium]
MLIDSHCHLDMLTPVKEGGGLDAVLEPARESGITHFLCVGVNFEDLPGMLSLIAGRENVFASAGVHPSAQPEAEPSQEDIERAASHPQVVAVGETGLDYYYDTVPREIQQERFRNHVRAAVKLDKPLIVHTRDAREDTITVLREEGAATCGGVLHCFTESWEMAAAAMDIGFYISLSGIVTFRNAEALRDVARRVPLDRLLVETDSPYLAPVPMRGKENRPEYVRHVAEFIAKERGIAFEELAKATTENFFRLFGKAKKNGQD